ncbi:MAG: hypothetical protein RQ731_08950 [Anaerosomatales bacterium]|nr:hypothetical protein [Anaerosomatales bacterium]
MATSASLDAEVAGFLADPNAADDVTGPLDEARTEIENVRDGASALNVGALVPPGRHRAQAEAIADHAEALLIYVDLLDASARFAIERAEAFAEVAGALDGLRMLSGEGVEVEEAERVVADVRADFEEARVEMHSQTPSVPVLFSNTHVLWRIDELSAPLTEIEQSIAERDVDRIERAFEAYAASADVDWPSYLATPDREGQQSARVAVDAVVEAVTAYESAREAAGSVRQTLLLVALLAIVAAVLVGAATLVVGASGRRA